MFMFFLLSMERFLICETDIYMKIIQKLLIYILNIILRSHTFEQE